MQSSNLERYYRDRLFQCLVAVQIIIRRRPTGGTQKAKYNMAERETAEKPRDVLPLLHN